jgi:hypothetical protein
VELSAVFQPEQWAEKETGKTIENRTQPELVPNQASKSNIVRGALKRFGLFAQLGEKYFFPTIGVAVSRYLETHHVEWEDWEDQD